MPAGEKPGTRVLLTYVMVGRGGDAVQLRALTQALGACGHAVRVVGGVPITPYADGGAGASARGLARKAPWWMQDLLEIFLSVVVATHALIVGRTGRCEVHFHRAGVYDAAMAIIARRLRVPLVLYLDAHLESERTFRGQAYWCRLHAWAMRTLGRAAKVIAVPSRPVAEYYVRLGLLASRMVIISNGVMRHQLLTGITALRERPPMRNPRQCMVGFVGSLAPWHRVDVLLRAMAELRRTAASPDVYRLVIIGRGAQYDSLRTLASCLELDGVVEWRGALPHDDALEAMGEFDIAVLPDTLPTGAPMKLVEYAAMGRVIVAPDLPNVRDLLESDRQVALVPPGDPHRLAETIRSLAGAPERARRMAAAAQAGMHDHLWEDAVQFLLDRALSHEPAHTMSGPSVGALSKFR